MFTDYKELRTKEERAGKTKRNTKGKRLPGRATSQQDTQGAEVPQFPSDPQILGLRNGKVGLVRRELRL